MMKQSPNPAPGQLADVLYQTPLLYCPQNRMQCSWNFCSNPVYSKEFAQSSSNDTRFSASIPLIFHATGLPRYDCVPEGGCSKRFAARSARIILRTGGDDGYVHPSERMT
ncbi:hypothetical protein [Parasphingorhabdus sp.]